MKYLDERRRFIGRTKEEDLMKNITYKTAESVRRGHPDKVADAISDVVLSYALDLDEDARVACETLVSKGIVVITGEVTCNDSHLIPYESLAKSLISDIGYNPLDFSYFISISPQSEDISRGVGNALDSGSTLEQGAGDQGTMYGYATSETSEYLPLPLVLSHKLCRELDENAELREEAGLYPDGKAQVTVEYENGKPKRVESVVVSVQHYSDLEDLREVIKEKLVKRLLKSYIDDNTSIFINPAGKFNYGGPSADAGLTGRKLMVDTYGGLTKHGGGAFSGKDPSKVDRSAAYMARHVAKSIVASDLASECEVGLSYAIGVANPVGVEINTFGTGDDDKIRDVVQSKFSLTPKSIIEELNLKRINYLSTSCYGHFSNPEFPWESVRDLEDEEE